MSSDNKNVALRRRRRIPWLAVLALLLALGMVLTLWLGRGSRHGYGQCPKLPHSQGAPLSTG